jgi:hypothetical protein
MFFLIHFSIAVILYFIGAYFVYVIHHEKDENKVMRAEWLCGVFYSAAGICLYYSLIGGS